jgi:superfamily I DNA/RNA helicase
MGFVSHKRQAYLDEDYLILSTIHSANGQEWDAVFVLNGMDGCIPSDMAACSAKSNRGRAPSPLRGDDTCEGPS